MSFDFSQFANMGTNEVGSAFGAKPEEVIADIAKEVAQVNGEVDMMCAPDVDFEIDDAIEPEEEEVETASAPAILTPEQIMEQAKFLKEQKAKSEAKEEPKKETKKDTKKDAKSAPAPKKEEKVVYSKPRRVMAYGDEVYTETRVEASLEDIRTELVSKYGYSEFKDSVRCNMIFDAKTGEVYPNISFNKKG